MKKTRKEFNTKYGSSQINTHESEDGLGVIIDKYDKDGELENSITVWYDDLETPEKAGGEGKTRRNIADGTRKKE